jgi:fatty-acid desaturase
VVREFAVPQVLCWHGTFTINSLAHKIGRAVYYMLSRGTVFSMEKFLAA